jgi:GNAT superfamily N-acetyltransferase
MAEAPTIGIRDARPDERGAIEALTIAAYQQYEPLMSGAWERYRQNIVATVNAPEPGAQMVAEHEGRLVGAALLYPAGTVFRIPDGRSVTLEWPEVRLLAVEPRARGLGIGAALMRESARRARQAGAAALTLHTTDMMRAAMRLYERLGFERAPELDVEPIPGIVAKGYRLVLDRAAGGQEGPRTSS